MKHIEKIYSIRFSKVIKIEDDFGGQVGLETEKEIFELNYNDCMDTYVSFCEDGFDCSYEPVDKEISNSIRALDQVLGYEISKLIKAISNNKPKEIITILGFQIETIKSCLDVVFQHSKVSPYNVETRYKEYYNYYTEKQKEII